VCSSDLIVNFFIQVNVSDESSKHGLQPNQVEDFLETLSQYKYVKVIGLMTMAPHTDDESVIEDTFKGLALLRDQVKEKYPTVTELSMGMSKDRKSTRLNSSHVSISYASFCLI